MRVHFYLDTVQKSGNAPVLMYLKAPGTKREKVRTGESVKPNLWDSKRERIKISAMNSMEINRRFDVLESQAQTFYREARDVLKIPANASYVKDKMVKWIDSTRSTPKDNVEASETLFTEYFEAFIAQLKAKGRADETISSYNRTLQHVYKFQTAYDIELTFAMMNVMFFEKFSSYFFNVAGLNNNSASLYFVCLRAFLRDSFKNGLLKTEDFRKFKVKPFEPDLIALTEAELEAIQNLSGMSKALTNTRDYWLVECLTGLRNSDVLRIRPEHFKGTYVMLHTQKTKVPIKVPLLPAARPLVERLINGDIKKRTLSLTNKNLETIAKLAGLTDVVEYTVHQGNKMITSTAPKYELITTHTGRRTFITLAFKKRIRREVIKKITGIRSDKTLDRYNRLTDETAEAEFYEAWSAPASGTIPELTKVRNVAVN